jgi:hypothetical protein
MSQIESAAAAAAATPSSGARPQWCSLLPEACWFGPRGHLNLRNNCITNAIFNQQHVYAGVKPRLKVVIGSLGLGVVAQGTALDDPKHGAWFEFGGLKHSKVEDFQKNAFLSMAEGRYDMHAWLEDDMGRVYDLFTLDLQRFATHWGRSLCKALQSTQSPVLLEQKPKRDLAAMGLHYVPASLDAQRAIFAGVMARKDFEVALRGGELDIDLSLIVFQ